MPRNVFKLFFWCKRTENSFPVNPELFCNTFLALLCMHVSVSVCSCLFTIVFLKSHLTSGHWTTTHSCQTGEECLSGLHTLHQHKHKQSSTFQPKRGSPSSQESLSVLEVTWCFHFPVKGGNYSGLWSERPSGLRILARAPAVLHSEHKGL